MYTATTPAGLSECWINLQLHSHLDKEVGRWVAGSPTLDVWSSGQTPQEALSRASQAIILFLNEATEMGTVWQILSKAGIDLLSTPTASATPSLADRLKAAFSDGGFLPAVFAVRAPDAAHC